MANSTLIDVDERLVDQEGKATDYFEDLWYQLLERTGGEGDDFIEDLTIQIESAVTARNSSKIANIRSQLADVVSLSTRLSMANQKIAKLTKQLQTMQATLDLPRNSDLASIKKRLDDLEALSGR